MDGRFTRAKLDDVLRRVCLLLGVEHHDATLLRFTNNAVYSLARDPIVVRIGGSRALRHRAAKVVRVARHLAEHGVPAVRLLADVPQPLEIGEHAVTVWHRVADTGRPAEPAELATLLRMVHALPVPDEVPTWTPLADVRARLSDAEELSAVDRRMVLERCAAVEARLGELEFTLPPSLLHGDAHPGNVIVGADGPVLCDFDSACVGPPEWDLVPLAVGVERFGDPPQRYAELALGYGYDVRSWGGFAVLRAARELKLMTSVLPIARSHPPVREELARRLADLRSGRMRRRWVRYR